MVHNPTRSWHLLFWNRFKLIKDKYYIICVHKQNVAVHRQMQNHFCSRQVYKNSQINNLYYKYHHITLINHEQLSNKAFPFDLFHCSVTDLITIPGVWEKCERGGEYPLCINILPSVKSKLHGQWCNYFRLMFTFCLLLFT